jgi:hypothetical protein
LDGVNLRFSHEFGHPGNRLNFGEMEPIKDLPERLRYTLTPYRLMQPLDL